jgi:hypothetical protein
MILTHKECHSVTHSKMGCTERHCVKQDKPDSERVSEGPLSYGRAKKSRIVTMRG